MSHDHSGTLGSCFIELLQSDLFVSFHVADTDGMLAKALLVGNFEAAVDICVSVDRMVSMYPQEHWFV